MAAYMETAAKANEVALQLAELVPPEQRAQAAILMAKLVNLGVRVSPRGVHHTVRLNAVQRAMKGLPVTVSMKPAQVKDRYGRPKTANILSLNGVVETETDDEAEAA